ncbi:hypothetical protein Hypma_015741 [Hypsizygus marmoreus]|uniref:C3H1-type domain-containing protein n=1 Tax=Hypsizygus marmoreus TaxID=39966 RepID=A0A369KCZ2_HYPMA|nr:hypothetical protein Hypma_015741 [Hypsizygus marmoreus]
MVSLLWKASSEGNLESVEELLKDATSVDMEIKDHTGSTPLIEAIKNGHVEVVRVLLDKGADPNNGSSQGRPEDYTSEPSILELLHHAQSTATSSGIPSHEPIYAHETNDDPEKQYTYGPSPPVSYPYYPSINSAPPPPESGVYYPSPQPPQAAGENPGAGGIGNLPPPEIARFIPCRYFPACRYGASCLFAHPQTPYYQGTMPPPAQYVAPYDPMNVQPYPTNYYPPPSFQPPTALHHMSPLSPPPGPHPGHGRSPSEVVLPVQPPFSPNGIPPSVPYGPMSPSAYPHPGQVPIPMSISPLPPLQHPSAVSAQPPSNMYNTVPAPAPPFVQHDGTSPYSMVQPHNPSIGNQEMNGDIKVAHSQPDGSGPINHHPNGLNHNRRGGPRRGSFGGRKPPCLFYPAGRCKNGDDCRFPHVLSDGSGNHTSYFSGGRGGARSRQPNGNGIATINEKLSALTVRDDQNGQQNGTEGSNHSLSTDNGRPRFPQGAKNAYVANGVRSDKRPTAVRQRVPNADEFPVLAGSITPPTRSPGVNGILTNGNGPTAAQVLQAPPPVRKDTSKESSTRGPTPDLVKPTVSKAELNGKVSDSTAPHDNTVNKLPVSFAAVAAPDIAKEITLSA